MIASFNPAFSGLLFVRLLGLAVGAWMLALHGTRALGTTHSEAEEIAYGAAILAFFIPLVRLGSPSDCTNRSE